jgi:hypothetical protein
MSQTKLLHIIHKLLSNIYISFVFFWLMCTNKVLNHRTTSLNLQLVHIHTHPQNQVSEFWDYF